MSQQEIRKQALQLAIAAVGVSTGDHVLNAAKIFEDYLTGSGSNAAQQDTLGHHGAVIGSPVEESTPLSRVQAERTELKARWDKLTTFIASDGYQVLSRNHRDLLTQQQDVMNHYGRILSQRIELLQRA